MTRHLARCIALVAIAVLSLSLAGCSFDYLNNLDRVTLAGGNAVQSNLQRETINPSSRRTYKRTDLGSNGGVIPDKSTKSTASPPTTTTTTAKAGA